MAVIRNYNNRARTCAGSALSSWITRLLPSQRLNRGCENTAAGLQIRMDARADASADAASRDKPEARLSIVVANASPISRFQFLEFKTPAFRQSNAAANLITGKFRVIRGN